MRAAIPRLTPIADTISRLVQNQYEENPYPRWVRMPQVEKAATITAYLRRKFPLAAFQSGSGEQITEFLSAGCGTGQLALDIAQGVAARVLAVDLSLASLGYARRKAQEFSLTTIEFCASGFAGTAHHRPQLRCRGMFRSAAPFGRPFAGWRALLSLLRPGGFMLVGLYSELARRGIVEARRYIARAGLWHHPPMT